MGQGYITLYIFCCCQDNVVRPYNGITTPKDTVVRPYYGITTRKNTVVRPYYGITTQEYTVVRPYYDITMPYSSRTRVTLNLLNYVLQHILRKLLLK